MCNPVSTYAPERLLAKGVVEGYEWECVHNPMGHRCGYVRIPPGHPWHGVPYDALDVEVHGELTFSQQDAACGRDGADDGWWLGFDCGHWMDLPDPDLVSEEFRTFAETAACVYEGTGAEVRSTEYVKDQCALLIAQAVKAAAAGGLA